MHFILALKHVTCEAFFLSARVTSVLCIITPLCPKQSQLCVCLSQITQFDKCSLDLSKKALDMFETHVTIKRS